MSNASKNINDIEQKQAIDLISTDTTNVISTYSTNDESFYEVSTNDDSSTPTVVHTTNWHKTYIHCFFINSWINHTLISINNIFEVKCNDEIYTSFSY